MVARKRTCSPWGPCRTGTARKGLLVRVNIGFAESSSKYTSGTLLLGWGTSPDDPSDAVVEAVLGSGTDREAGGHDVCTVELSLMYVCAGGDLGGVKTK